MTAVELFVMRLLEGPGLPKWFVLNQSKEEETLSQFMNGINAFKEVGGEGEKVECCYNAEYSKC